MQPKNGQNGHADNPRENAQAHAQKTPPISTIRRYELAQAKRHKLAKYHRKKSNRHDRFDWGSFVLNALIFCAAAAAAVAAIVLAGLTNQSLIDARESSRISHRDTVNAENLTADALGQAQTNASTAHGDSAAALKVAAAASIIQQKQTAAALTKAAEANTIAQNTAHTQLRAYVFPDTDAPIKVIVVPSVTSKMEAEVWVKNFGQTPALGLIVRSWVKFDTWPLPPNSDFPTPMGVPPVGKTLPQGGFVIYHTGSSRPFTEDQFSDFESGRKVIYVYGDISYSDTFGASHNAQFCYGMPRNPPYPVVAAQCDQHVSSE